jgi:hypothetical protein
MNSGNLLPQSRNKERPRVHAGPSSRGYSPRGGYFKDFTKNRRPHQSEAVGSGLLTLTGYSEYFTTKETTPHASGVV